MSTGDLTTSQVKKAGRTIRRYMRGDIKRGDPGFDEQLTGAITIIDLYRAAHQRPLVTANNGLRSMVRSEGCVVEVSQRLKRFPTIIDKLVREPTLPLSSMQDIGGCRAILADVAEVRRVEARLRKNRPPVGYTDYIEAPRSSGYRGVHVIVEYQGRQIEVQLRTKVMHEWAIAVERLSSRVGANLKQDGEHAIQALMSTISTAMAIEEGGGTVPEEVHFEISQRRMAAAPYLGWDT